MESRRAINNKTYLIVLPVVNELTNLEKLIPAIWALHPEIEILIVDDDSQDGTGVFVSELQAEGKPLSYIRRRGKLGIGSAHLAGLDFGRNEYFEFIITMDADLTHRPVDLGKFIDSEKGSDLLIGSRYLDKSNMVGWSFFRKSLTKIGHLVTATAFFKNWDMSSGMRMYRTTSIPLKSLKSNCPNDYAFFFTSAITYKKLLLTVSQIPIILNQRSAGESKMTLALMYRGTKLLALYALRIKRIQTNKTTKTLD